MKVCVIIPYVNEKMFIGDCLDSLEEQTCRDFEAIVVFDHSREESRQVLFGKTVSFPLRTLELGEDRGVAAARNLGMDSAEGEYILFLDSDDYLERTAIQDMLQLMQEGTDIVHAGLRKTWYGRKVYDDNGEKLEAQNSIEEKKRREITDLTVLGYMFRRDYLRQNELYFDDSLCYYPDLYFITAALNRGARVVETEKILYLKRQHNDPVRRPSLTQIPDEKGKNQEVMQAYQQIKKEFSETEWKELDDMFIRYFIEMIVPWFLTAIDIEIPQMYKETLRCLEILPDDAVKRAEPRVRRFVEYAQKHNLYQLIRKIRRQKKCKTCIKILTSRAALKEYLYGHVFCRMKLKESTILFESFLGRSYSDNPKYIFEYLGKHLPGRYKCIWVLDHKRALPYPAKQIRRYSFRYFYYMARAKYIVFNGRQPKQFIKRQDNIFLQTWHGTPLKKLVFDMDEVTSADPLYKWDAYHQSIDWDYLIAANAFSEETFCRCFMFERDLLRTGYPRNDILYLEQEERQAVTDTVRSRVGVPEGKKVILYAPTWRDDEYYGPGRHKFTAPLDMEKMKRELGSEYVILLRVHYFVADRMDLSGIQDFVFDVSEYEDIAELYLASDLLITDYSSVFFDYANLGRPILFYTYDLERYRDKLRGFYLDMEKDLPGPLLYSTEEVVDAVRNLQQIRQDYQERYRSFCETYCDWEDGNASQRVVESVFDGGQESRK